MHTIIPILSKYYGYYQITMENENYMCALERPARRPVSFLPKLTVKMLCSLPDYYGNYYQITLELTIKSLWNLLCTKKSSKYYDHYQITVETENAMCVPERPAWRAVRPLAKT